MQLKYSFKKEWAHFSRTFKMWGVIIAILATAVFIPILFKGALTYAEAFALGGQNMSSASIAVQVSSAGFGGTPGDIGIDMEEEMATYSDAGLMFSLTLTSFASYGLLAVMLLLMSAAGGEQKKRAMIVPMCSGLEYKNYLIPKFVIYPLFTFALTFLSALAAGGLCNAMFPNNKITAAGLFLSGLDISVYMVFVLCVFLSLGLCTSRAGAMVPCIFFGQMLAESLLEGIGLMRYHPFALLGYAGSGMMTDPLNGSFDAEIPSFITALALSLVICVIMYFLALGVLKAKKINNQEDIAPEF